MEKVTVVFWDVQHGNAVYIRTPNNRHIVIDLGTGSYGKNNLEFSPLIYLKNKYKVTQIDYVIVTHPHLDHIDDILNFDELSPKIFTKPDHLTKEEIIKDVSNKDKPKFEKYFEISEIYKSPVPFENDPSNSDNYGGLMIKGFSPTKCSNSNINNHSIIEVISFAGKKIVFTGDNEECSFNELLEKPGFKETIQNADILLAPHHGRGNGFHSKFVNLVNPKLTVISDGGFSDTSVTDKYSQKSGGMIVQKRNGDEKERHCVTTRKDGTIVVEFGYYYEILPFLSVKIN